MEDREDQGSVPSLTRKRVLMQMQVVVGEGPHFLLPFLDLGCGGLFLDLVLFSFFPSEQFLLNKISPFVFRPKCSTCSCSSSPFLFRAPLSLQDTDPIHARLTFLPTLKRGHSVANAGHCGVNMVPILCPSPPPFETAQLRWDSNPAKTFRLCLELETGGKEAGHNL